MQSRSGKSSRASLVSFGVFAALGTLATWAPSTWATITVTAGNGNFNGGVSSGANGTQTFYYSLLNPGDLPTLAFYVAGGGPVSPAATYATDPNQNAFSQAIAINVNSSLGQSSYDSGGPYFMTLQLVVNGTPVGAFIPITGYNTSGGNGSCTAGNTQCSTMGITAAVPNGTYIPGQTYQGGVNYNIAGQGLNLFIYPEDICAANSASLTGVCGTNAYPAYSATASPTPNPGGDYISPQAGQPVTVTFRAALFPYNGNSLPTNITSPLDSSSNVALSFQIDAPTENCPQPVIGGGTFPGDTQLLVNTGSFGLATPPPSTADAPEQALYVVADPSPSPVVEAPVGNAIAQFLSANSTQQAVHGFVNTTSATNIHPYNVGFYIEDYTGMMLQGSSPSTCEGVAYTFPVQGFISSGSHCFIASAAFRDGNAAPVMLLRQFRDRILLNHAWGRKFVNYYYDRSPLAAEWLSENPGYRFPVLVALVPLEAVAWIALHGFVFAGLLAAGLTLLIFAGILRLRSPRLSG